MRSFIVIAALAAVGGAPAFAAQVVALGASNTEGKGRGATNMGVPRNLAFPAQLERMLATPIDEAVIPSMVRVANEADREKIREIVRDEVYPADVAFLEALVARGEK